MYNINFHKIWQVQLFNFRSTTPQNWEDFSRYNKERAEAEMAASRRLREAIHHTIQQTDNDLDAQRQASDYAYRKRMHEFKRALDELDWQKDQVSLGRYCHTLCNNFFRIHSYLRYLKSEPFLKYRV